MVSDSQLVNRLQEILSTSDLETTTAAGLRRRLEEEFSVDLYGRRVFIREQIDLFLRDYKAQQKQEDEAGVDARNDAVQEELGRSENENAQEEEEEAEGEGKEVIDEERSNKTKKRGVKQKGRGFNKPCSLSPKLQEFLGVRTLARTEVVKRLWAYIREHNLQNPKNRRKILCDESLRGIFNVKSIDMFQMNKALTKHIWPLDEAEEEEASEEEFSNEEEEDQEKEEEEEEEDQEKEEEDLEEKEEEEEEKEEQGVNEEGRNKKRKSMETDVKQKGGRGFTKPCALSPQLQKLVGVPELARTEVVKRIWAHIREHNLQNPKNKKIIICDEPLLGIFRVKSIDMFQMNKRLSKHIWPLDETEATPVKSSQKENKRNKGREEGSNEPKRKEKARKVGGSGLTKSLPLSDALIKFFGTGENELSRNDVVRKIWQYIKENELQDPSDKRMVLCDEKLKELFEVDTFHGFTVSKLLTSHFIK